MADSKNTRAYRQGGEVKQPGGQAMSAQGKSGLGGFFLLIVIGAGIASAGSGIGTDSPKTPPQHNTPAPYKAPCTETFKGGC